MKIIPGRTIKDFKLMVHPAGFVCIYALCTDETLWMLVPGKDWEQIKEIPGE